MVLEEAGQRGLQQRVQVQPWPGGRGGYSASVLPQLWVILEKCNEKGTINLPVTMLWGPQLAEKRPQSREDQWLAFPPIQHASPRNTASWRQSFPRCRCLSQSLVVSGPTIVSTHTRAHTRRRELNFYHVKDFKYNAGGEDIK